MFGPEGFWNWLAGFTVEQRPVPPACDDEWFEKTMALKAPRRIDNRGKPHLFKSNGKWCCRSMDAVAGGALTATAAYESWKYGVERYRASLQNAFTTNYNAPYISPYQDTSRDFNPWVNHYPH